MKTELLEERIDIPDGATVTIADAIVTIEGPKGKVSRPIVNKRMLASVSGNTVVLFVKNATKREKKLIFTYASHIRNMCRGVTEGYTYKLKICSGHFPMNVSLKGNTFEIKNFIGEAVPRTLTIKQGVDVKLDGEIITVTGIDKELVSQVAASIENLTRRPGFDSRIFQDGIYLIEKDGKELT